MTKKVIGQKTLMKQLGNVYHIFKANGGRIRPHHTLTGPNGSIEDLYTILDNPDLLENYLKLFEDVDRDEVISLIQKYLDKHYELNILGARLIDTLINQYFINGSKLKDQEL